VGKGRGTEGGRSGGALWRLQVIQSPVACLTPPNRLPLPSSLAVLLVCRCSVGVSAAGCAHRYGWDAVDDNGDIGEEDRSRLVGLLKAVGLAEFLHPGTERRFVMDEKKVRAASRGLSGVGADSTTAGGRQ